MSIAQKNSEDVIREMEEQKIKMSTEIESARQSMLLQQLETTRLKAEIERLKLERGYEATSTNAPSGLTALYKSAEADLANKRAEEAVAAALNEIAQKELRARNNLYLAGIIAIFTILGALAIKLKPRSPPMKDHEKFGLIIIVGSFLLATFALVISDWLAGLDFLNNLMLNRIRLIKSDDFDSFLIDIPTKYLLLVCLSLAAYGGTTYLGITPSPRYKEKSTSAK